MPRHKLRESVKSFFGSHERDEELKGTNAEMDGKVERILRILKEGDDQGAKGTLVNLVEDFRNQYQSLYSRYDSLSGELRKQVQGKQQKDSSSSSSDSESDSSASPKKKGRKDAKTDNDLQNSITGIKQELETAILEIADLKKKLETAAQEKEVINLEYQNALSKIQEMASQNYEASVQIKALKDQVDAKQQELDSALSQNFESDALLEKRDQENLEYLMLIETLKKELVDNSLEQQKRLEENEALVFQVKDLELQLNSMQEIRSNFDEQLRNEWQGISEFLTEIETLKYELAKKTAEQLKTLEENENLVLTVKDLKQDITSLTNLKDELEQQLNNKTNDLSQLQEAKERIQVQISEMEKARVEKDDELSTLKNKYESEKTESSVKISAFTEEVNSLQRQIDSLNAQKSEVDSLVDRNREEISELLIHMKKLKEELSRRTEDSQRLLLEKDGLTLQINDLKEQLNSKIDEGNRLNEEKTGLQENLKSAKKKMQEMTEEFSKDMHVKNQKVKELEKVIEKLKTDLKIKGDEVNILTDKEKSHVTEEGNLHEERRLLQERISVLSGIIGTYQEAQLKIKSEISQKVNDSLTGLDAFTVKFEEDYSQLESRICEIMKQIKAATRWIQETNHKNDHMKKDVADLIQQLKDEKEQESILRKKIGELETALTKDETDRESLIKTVKQLENKTGEVERMIKEKDEKLGELERILKDKDVELLSMGAEKKEAIRQLCLWIDYHQNRYDDLKNTILKTTGRRKQIAT